MSAPTSAAQAPLSRRASIAAGLAFIAAGMYPLAIGLGFAAARPGSVHAPLWVVAIAGACFVFIGAAFAVPRGDVRSSRLSLSAIRVVPQRPETFALMRVVCFEASNHST